MILTRTMSFRVHDMLQTDGKGSWLQAANPITLNQEVLRWAEEVRVPIISVSAPTTSVVGKDEFGNLHLLTSLSIIYIAEQEAEEDYDDGEGIPELIETIRGTNAYGALAQQAQPVSPAPVYSGRVADGGPARKQIVIPLEDIGALVDRARAQRAARTGGNSGVAPRRNP